MKLKKKFKKNNQKQIKINKKRTIIERKTKWKDNSTI